MGPSDRWYEPPEPPSPCCGLYEDDDEHDYAECLADQAEADAERRAEIMREDRMFDRYEP